MQEAEIDVQFAASCSKEDIGLSRCQFAESLVRLANFRFKSSTSSGAYSESLRLLFGTLHREVSS